MTQRLGKLVVYVLQTQGKDGTPWHWEYGGEGVGNAYSRLSGLHPWAVNEGTRSAEVTGGRQFAADWRSMRTGKANQQERIVKVLNKGIELHQ